MQERSHGPRRRITRPAAEEHHRSPGALLVSIALHVLAGAFLVYVVSIPYGLGGLLRRSSNREPAAERVQYVPLARAGPPRAGRSGGDGRPATSEPRRIVAPTAVPSAIPAPDSSRGTPAGGSGPVVGDGGPTRGIIPTLSDPRVWATPGPMTFEPGTPSERMDSSITAAVEALSDSQQMLAGRRAPGDWTTMRGGKKYGIDQNKIYIGDISIPTAILALLPLNQQSNRLEYERNRALSYQRQDINYQAQRAINEDEFRAAVKRIRERKERERKEKAKAAGSQPAPGDLVP